MSESTKGSLYCMGCNEIIKNPNKEEFARLQGKFCSDSCAILHHIAADPLLAAKLESGIKTRRRKQATKSSGEISLCLNCSAVAKSKTSQYCSTICESIHAKKPILDDEQNTARPAEKRKSFDIEEAKKSLKLPLLVQAQPGLFQGYLK